MVQRQLGIILIPILFTVIKSFHISGGKRTIITSFQQVKHNDLPSYLVTKSKQFRSNTKLFAAAGGGKKKRRRRKKTTETSPIEEKSVDVDTKMDTTEKETVVVEEISEEIEIEPLETKPMDESTKTPTFKFNRDEAIALGISDADEDDEDGDIMPMSDIQGGTTSIKPKDLTKGAIELPDLKDTVKKKTVVETKKGSSGGQTCY